LPEPDAPPPVAVVEAPTTLPDPVAVVEAPAAVEIANPALPVLPVPELTEDALAVAYAATGIWSQPPATPAPAREGRLTAQVPSATDTRVPDQPDPSLRLAETTQTDPAPAEPDAPPPPGVSFRLDARGLVVPTVEGVPTPSGTIVYLGRPDLVPPGRTVAGAAPAEATLPDVAVAPDPAPSASSDVLAAAVAGALADLPFALPGTPDTPPRPRPAGLVAPAPAANAAAAPTEAPVAEAPNPLAGFRPRPRPASEPAVAPDQDAALSPNEADASDPATADIAAVAVAFADPALAGFRPRSRPVTEATGAAAVVVPDAEAAPAPGVTRAPPAADPVLAGFRPRPRAGALPASDDPAEVADTAVVAPLSFPDASRLAVAVTPVPQARPQGFAVRAAAAAAAAAVAAVAPTAVSAPAAVASAPEAEAEADGEADVVASAARAPASGPRLPTRASVADQATIENAIRLNQVNLIGIYGSSADRRALVRLPSGRYVKVEVGDRVDGGRVAAISDRELQLVKNGRNVVLRIAQGG
jgi:hypothetical protein